MSMITYTSSEGRSHALSLGVVPGIGREGACLDICLARAVAVDCPLVVQVLIRTNGTVDLWRTAWESGASNTNWNFSAGEPRKDPTPEQLTTLERMFLGLEPMPGDLGSALGGPVCTWAFEGRTPEDVAAAHDIAPRFMA